MLLPPGAPGHDGESRFFTFKSMTVAGQGDSDTAAISREPVACLLCVLPQWPPTCQLVLPASLTPAAGVAASAGGAESSKWLEQPREGGDPWEARSEFTWRTLEPQKRVCLWQPHGSIDGVSDP
ncbi:uncharacterized protein LOC115830856 [Nomascus leucogenys]|uniref:uncharacterized protein LOC115830856 n=1 Tax=Nomascus leucogenys TaxID=61853 RepID=UPI00122D6961|nr:uncharacterized protein LOC115830856 [Nomascus leucogenys]